MSRFNNLDQDYDTLKHSYYDNFLVVSSLSQAHQSKKRTILPASIPEHLQEAARLHPDIGYPSQEHHLYATGLQKSANAYHLDNPLNQNQQWSEGVVQVNWDNNLNYCPQGQEGGGNPDIEYSPQANKAGYV